MRALTLTRTAPVSRPPFEKLQQTEDAQTAEEPSETLNKAQLSN